MRHWQEHYLEGTRALPIRQHRPIIGITGNYGEKGCELARGYWQSILEAGGTPMIIPPCEDREVMLATLESVDALLFSGGADLNPLLVGEEPIPGLHGICPERDLSELLLARLAYDRQIPMLGICRGIQTLAVALDGSVYQDLDSQYKDAPLIKHDQNLDRTVASHTVEIETESLLHHIMDSESVHVNSFHHQAVRDAGPHLQVVARSVDGVIEAVESNEHKSILGVQWHPECFVLAGDSCMMPLFRWLVGEAKSFAEARRLHRSILTLDSHCDTPMFFDQDIHFGQRDPHILVDLHKMAEGHLDASIMVAYLPQGARDNAGHESATAMAQHLLTEIQDMVHAHQEHVAIATSPAELYVHKREGRKSIMMGIENGYAIGHDVQLVEHFRQQGVVYMTLCHNGDNDICDSARGNNEHEGVSPFGADVIHEMNRVGMIVDLSHASERSFYDALDISSLPIVCSHSSSRALCDHPRNLTDDQMRALARKGGVAQVTFYNGFLRADGQATILDAIEHLHHMVDVMGIEHVGIGTDFDGDGGVPGLASASELINLTRHLLRKRYSENDLRLIWGENFLRVMRQVQEKK